MVQDEEHLSGWWVLVVATQLAHRRFCQFVGPVESPLFSVQFALWVTNSVAQLERLQHRRSGDLRHGRLTLSVTA